MMIKIVGEMEKYTIEGVAEDNAWLARNRELLDAHLLDDMRTNNVLPVLDYSPELQVELTTGNKFAFRLWCRGFPVDNARGWLGILVADRVVVSVDGKHVELYEP